MCAVLLATLLALLTGRAAAEDEELPLVAALSQSTVGINTGFTGASLLVFGATGQPIGPGGDEVVIVVRGPTRPVVVRRKVPVLGVLWVNGPAARFEQVPGYYAVAATRPAWQLLPEEARRANGIGFDALPLDSTGARSPQFRAALLALEQEAGVWLEYKEPVEIRGNRLFNARIALPATVPTGNYKVEVLLVRSRRVAAREELAFEVDRVGTTDRVATIAELQPLLYGLACIVLAGFAGWAGSIIFRRG